MKIAIFLLLMCIGGGCKKCYECSTYNGCVECVKATDSTIICNSPASGLTDSINTYISHGYICDSIDKHFISDRACNKEMKAYFEKFDWVCK
jgi:hypothetical protein